MFSAWATWFKGPEDRHIAKRILAKGEEVSVSNVLDLHYIYSQMVKVYYKDRDTTPTGLADAISVCEKQIALSVDAAQAFLSEYSDRKIPAIPAHSGYTQLCIIREKEHEYEEAIRLATQAMEQGWMGDWEKRIARSQKRLK